MVKVGMRELKQKASELVRIVRETGTEVQVTYHGKVVALLIPVRRSQTQAAAGKAWAEIDHLAAEIGVQWPAGVSAAEAISEQRR